MLPGPVWTDADQAQVFTLLATTARPGGIAVILGSPPGVPHHFPVRLAAAMPNSLIVLDTSGPTLIQTFAQPIPGLAVLRMDSDEAEALSGHPLPEAKATADFASALTVAAVLIARGAEGNVMAAATQHLIARRKCRW